MKLPIRNGSKKPLTLFLEPYCDEFVVGPGLEAIVWLSDTSPVEIEVRDDLVVIWSQDNWLPTAEVISEDEQSIVVSLKRAQAWLHTFDVPSAQALGDEVDRLENLVGHVEARASVFVAFYRGFCIKSLETCPTDAVLPAWLGAESLEGCYRAGGMAAHQNHVCRGDDAFPGPGLGPFDGNTGSTFRRAAAAAGMAGLGPDTALEFD